MGNTYDAIVIGAGIMGASTALHLARRGLKVVALEKRFVGAGSTGKSSAIIRQHYSNELTAKMALHSLRVFQNFAEEVGGECGFTPDGFVALVADKDRAGLESNVALQRSLGINTEMLSAGDLRDILPDFESADLVAAAYEPESGYADPNLTLNGYIAAAKSAGASVYQETEVVGVCFESGRVTGVETPKGRFSAPIVINCAGPWGARVGRMAGVDLPISPCRVQVAFFRRPPDHADPHPVVGDFVHGAYFRSETGGLTLVGLIDASEAEAIVNPDGFNEAVDFAFVAEAGERLIQRVPYMERSEHTGGYAALYAVTPDWHPVVDEVPQGSGFFVCAGFSGHGFKLGPAVGLMMADLVTKDAMPTFDPGLFRLSRYTEGDPVTGQYEYSIAG
ncbi:MAG: FAD-binding oxidoreductase [Chloroflexi bacterium]|nr:FAD-binding oxidoreductase [Chloroflexota bacterium]